MGLRRLLRLQRLRRLRLPRQGGEGYPRVGDRKSDSVVGSYTSRDPAREPAAAPAAPGTLLSLTLRAAPQCGIGWRQSVIIAKNRVSPLRGLFS
jgi:hypothetical protein